MIPDIQRAGGDPPAALFLERCLLYAREGAPEGWKCVTVFGEKQPAP